MAKNGFIFPGSLRFFVQKKQEKKQKKKKQQKKNQNLYNVDIH